MSDLLEPLDLFCNLSEPDSLHRLMQSFSSLAEANSAIFSQVDTTRPVTVRSMKLDPTQSNPSLPYIAIDPTGWSAVVAVGLLDQPATSGTFTVTDVGASQTTGAIAFNASAATLQADLRSSLSTNFSACVVTGANGGPWTIDRVTTGAFGGTLSGDTTNTSPPSCVFSVQQTRPGTTGTSAEYIFTLTQGGAILATLSGSYLPAAAINVTPTQTGSAGVNAIQEVVWNPDAYAGTVSLTLALPTGGSIVSASNASPTVFTTSSAHLLKVGDSVTIAGCSDTGLNGTHTVSVIGSPTTFKCTSLNSSGSTGGTVAVARGVGPLAFDIATSDFVTALVAHGASTAVMANFQVAQNGPGDYSVTFCGALGSTAIATMSATQALKVPLGLSGTMNCNTESVAKMLSGAVGDVTARLEVKLIDADGNPMVAAVRNDAILRPSIFVPSLVGSDPMPSLPTMPVICELDGIGANQGKGLALQNVTPASGGTLTQWSPTVDFVGSYFDGDSSTSFFTAFRILNEPNSGGPGSGVLTIMAVTEGTVSTSSGVGALEGNYSTVVFQLDNSGDLTIPGLFVSGNLQANLGAFMTVTFTTLLDSTESYGTEGQALLVNSLGAAQWTTLGGPYLIGDLTGTSEVSGTIGEVISGSFGSSGTPSVSLSSGTPANVGTISLPAGHWDIEATVYFQAAGSTVVTAIRAGISTTSATLGSAGSYSAFGGAITSADDTSLIAPTFHVSPSNTTNVYIVAKGAFTTSTLKCYGAYRAIRTY